MLPILYSLGNFNVYAFGSLTALSFLVSTFVVWKLAKEEFKEEDYLDAYFYTALVALIVARIVYIFRNWNDFGFIFLKYFLVVETPGLSLLGGVIGGFIFLYFYSKNKKINFYHIIDVLSIAGALSLSLIKIGQQLSGAAFGAQTDFFLKVKIAGRPGFYHPAELYESIIYFILFLILFYLYKLGTRKKWDQGIIFSVFAIVMSISTILLEFIKVYHVYLYGLSFRQILGIIIIIESLLFLGVRLKIIKNFLNYFKKNKI